MSKIHISQFPEGYILPSGKRLTREDAEIIGRAAGLNMTHVSADDEDYLKPEWIPDGNGGHSIVHTNPVHRPYIYEKSPLPPTLQFYRSDAGLGLFSSYTINLKTLEPTSRSPNQNRLPEDIRSKLT